MEKKTLKLMLEKLEQIGENQLGQLQGGFDSIDSGQTTDFFAINNCKKGICESNNCVGGNCVTGCGTN